MLPAKGYVGMLGSYFLVYFLNTMYAALETAFNPVTWKMYADPN